MSAGRNVRTVLSAAVPFLAAALLCLAARTAPAADGAFHDERDGAWRCAGGDGIETAIGEYGRISIVVRPRGSALGTLVLSRRGHADAVAGAPPPLPVDGALEIRDGALGESFECLDAGLEYRFHLRDPASGIVRIDFDAGGDLTPKVPGDGARVVFLDRAGAPVLFFDAPPAADAEGRDVAVRWERVEGDGTGSTLRLLVAAEGHRPPVTIRTRLVAAKRSTSSSSAVADAAPLPAAPPANDTCAVAVAIPAGGPFPYLAPVVDLTDATSAGDPPPPSCQSDVSRGVWFAFTPQESGAYSFSVCADAPAGTTVEDTVLALFAAGGACAGLSEIGCSDDACGSAGLQSSLAEVPLAAGNIYYVLVWTFGTGAPATGLGEVQLRVDRTAPTSPPPANDRCEDAITVPASGPFPWLAPLVPDIGGATMSDDPPSPTCQPNVSRSIWYRFTPAASGRYQFSVCADAPTGTTVDDTVLAVYAESAACSGLAEVPGACDDDSCAGEPAQSRTAGTSLNAGTTYEVVVWKYGVAVPPPGQTAIQLRVEQVTAPPNDTCAAAAVLPFERPLDGTTVAAFDDTRLPAASPCFAGVGQTPSTASGRDVAYRFTAPAGDRYSFRVTGAHAGSNIVVYASADCPAAPPPATLSSCLLAANRSAAQPEELDCLALAAGQAILVTVDEDAATAGGDFTIEATACTPEAEPNGTPAAAGAAGCFTEGSIVPAADADFFLLGSPAALSRVFAIVDGAAAGTGDFDLRVTTASDTLEYDDFNNDLPFGSSAPNISGTPLPGGPAYLRVTHYNSTAQSAPYRLCAVVRPPAAQATPEAEPNDTPSSATPSGSGYLAGALAGAADVDLFSFEATTGELIQLGLDLDPLRNGTPFNGSLALLDGAGSPLLAVNDASSTSSTTPGTGSLSAASPFSPGEALLYRARSTGPYRARVAFSSGTPGDYLLSIARHPPAAPPDLDGDGVADAGDCAPADPAAWGVPGEATSLGFPAPADPTLLQWTAPAAPGGVAVRYDVLRSVRADDWLSATCLLSGSIQTSAVDPTQPANALFYLVRSVNVCGGNAGRRSDGTPRIAAACP